MELENVDLLSQSNSSTTILLVSQTTESTLQQSTNLTTLNSEFESINDEFDENQTMSQRFKTVKEAYVIVKLFAHSNRFGIQKGHVEKDTSGDFYKTHNILDLQTFKDQFKSLQEYYPKAALYLNRALYSDKRSWARAYTFHHFTAGAQATSHMQDDDNDAVFIDNAFDYPLAYSLMLFKQVEDKVVEVWETIRIAQKAINIAIEKDNPNILKFLKTYILQNDYFLVENTTNTSASSHKTSILEEHLKPNIIVEKIQSSKAQEKQSKSYTKYVNKACNSTIMYEFCGGRGHKKELHDYACGEKGK
ncbi:22347_t:CDS:2 [Racocetra persica]|uniref:22347_t:CDS:1 n=1 Tax=Racocetra persica TaxID=160502 RepID=A0ACA9KPZ5_9GLOM|nr:22347_t:CDS:2 [Racocetra persica]